MTRQFAFARLEGLLGSLGIPTSDRAWTTLKVLQENGVSIKSEQIEFLHQFVEQVIEARDRVVKAKILAAVDATPL